MTAKANGKTKRHVEWGKIRKLYEEGGPEVTFSSLARDGWASRSEISRQAKAQGWHRPDVSTPEMRAKIAARADEKGKVVTGEVVAPDPPPGVASLAAVDAQIEQRAGLLDRHRREWNSPRKKIYDGLQQSDFNKLKEGKIAAEALTLIQNGERKAWGLDGDPTIILKVIPPSKRDLDDD